jgi:Rrf2 family protein
MLRYGKTTRSAIAAMSRLAQAWGDPGARLSSADIARSRNLPQPVVAKLLTILGQNGLVAGAPGPGGGYRLGRAPSDISLFDVARLFEREEEEMGCPFGPGWCGTREPCPLHHDLERLRRQTVRYLQQTRFDVFVGSPRRRGRGAGSRYR